MPESFELKPISPAAVPAALERAQRYRLLNKPEQAESICLDILDADPDHQEALVTLILALTDQFTNGGASAQRAADYVERLDDEYRRSYYRGIIHERQAQARLGRGKSRVFAYDAFREAMEWFDKAAALRPVGNDEALLRWNACVRAIRARGLKPRPAEAEHALE